MKIVHSKNTGRIRHIWLKGILLATLRPSDGLLSLTIAGARRLVAILNFPRFRVVVHQEVEGFVREGRDVFARHVTQADKEIRPGEEVIVTDRRDEVLAIGKALLTGREMLVFKRGVAVKVRRGNES